MSRPINFRYLSEYLEYKKEINSTEFKEFLAKKGIKEKTQKPPTEKQKAQMARFGLVTKFASQISEVLAVGLKTRKAFTRVNLAVKMYLKKAVVGEYPNFRIDYSMVDIANGPWHHLGKGHRTVLSLTGLGCMSWNWTQRQGQDADTGDARLYLLIYNATSKTIVYKGVVGHLSEGRAAFHITPFERSDELHAWIFGLSLKGSKATISDYIPNIGIID